MASEKTKAAGDWTKVAGVGLAAATLVVTAFRDSDKVPWLKYAGWPAVVVAALLVVFFVWKFVIAPWRRKCVALRLARAKVVDLPDFITRFKHDVVGVDRTNSIAYQVSQITLQPNDATTPRPDARKQAYYVTQVLDQMLQRFEMPVEGLADIQLIFAVFDDFVRYVHDTYRDEWRTFLMTNRPRIPDHSWTQCIKAREAYAKFVDDYRIFRKSKEKDADAIGSGYYYETPDPLG
jgi:hypothetical protein